ncbi:hypothetical protein [Chryseobacterium sp. JV274]|uniref:hypothetical protein n=1 Tax=Chryseobacterium sp. JV274 TaxID=1932669 RepID=UPI0015C24109|nr:hypothetical protein [Chryseobacterium sp. JV274]CAD0220296.1 conserved protein of unknown function [Chryseobacterium sp. JV274]
MEEEKILSEEEKVIAEEKELKVLNSVGFAVKTSFWGKELIWNVNKIPLKVMFAQSYRFFKLKVFQEKQENDDFQEILNSQFNSVADNAKLCAEIIAITILGTKWNNWLFRKLLTEHLFNNINSRELLEFTQNVLSLNDYQSFTISTTLLSAVRVTNPMKVEKTA